MYFECTRGHGSSDSKGDLVEIVPSLFAAQHGLFKTIDKLKFHSKHNTNNNVTYSDSVLHVLLYKINPKYYFYCELYNYSQLLLLSLSNIVSLIIKIHNFYYTWC